jgi:EmrB/QacA subfamily drug resistance transporter
VGDLSISAEAALAPRRVPGDRALALVVATAFFMEQLDSTVITTALPAMAGSFQVNPLHMSMALTAYLVSLTAFIPASGRLADWFGGRRVFCAALAVFTVSSVLCSYANTLWALVAARFVQGIGGAMMVPVGRLVLLRTVPKARVVRAMAWVLMPTMVAPILGPLVGGFLVTYFSWRWIFYINIPIGIAGFVAALVLFPDHRHERTEAFDTLGLAVSALALSCFVIGLELLNWGAVDRVYGFLLLAAAIGCGFAYARHARRYPHPILDFTLTRIPTFAIAMWAGTLFRIGISAVPFLLPMMLQLGFGLSALRSGLLTFSSGVAAFAVKATTVQILRRVGYRDAMIWNSVLASLFLALCAFFRPAWPRTLLYGVLLLGGFVRSLQFNALGTIAFADVPQGRMSAATSLHSVTQQVSGTAGISISAAILAGTVLLRGHTRPELADFSVSFLTIAAISAFSVPYCLRLARDAGAELSGQRTS